MKSKKNSPVKSPRSSKKDVSSLPPPGEANSGFTTSLQTNDPFFRQVIDSLEDYAVFTTDISGIINSWNSGAQRLFGYDEKEIVGKSASVLFLSDDKKKKVPLKERVSALESGRGIDERWHIRKDGTRFWASGLVFPLRDESETVIGFTKIARDLTERKKREDEESKMIIERAHIQRSEIRYRTMIEQSPQSIQIVSLKGTTLLVNKAWEKLWGLTFEQLAGYNMLKDKQLVELGIMPYIKKGMKGEAVIIPAVKYEPAKTLKNAANATYRWVKGFIYPVKDEKGKVQEVVLIHEDITEQKHNEDKLRESEERFRTLIERSTDAIQLVSPDGRILYSTESIKNVLGYSANELLGESVAPFMHPDDFPLGETTNTPSGATSRCASSSVF